MKVGRSKDQDESTEAKRTKHTTTPSSCGDSDCPWTALGVQDTEKTEGPEDVPEKSVGSDVEHFEALAVSSTSKSPHDTLKDREE